LAEHSPTGPDDRRFARARGADHDDQVLRGNPLEQRGGERFAAAEERGVLLAEGLQAAVRADLRARIAPLLGRAGGFAADGLGQQLKAMVEIRAEVDPGIEAEKTQGWVLDAREDDREDDRDDAEGRLLRLAVEGLVLLALLPGAKAIWAEQDGDSAAAS
jgi:hypothetical protein